MRYVLRFGKCYVLRSLETAKRNAAAKRKQCYVLRDHHLRFGSYSGEIVITFCVNLLRFALRFYVLGNVTFCGPTCPLDSRCHKSDEGASHSITMALLCFFVVILKILICIGPRPTMYQNQNQNFNLFDPHTIYIIAMLT